MNFKYMMVAVAMSTLVGHGAMAIGDLSVGMAYTSVGVGRLASAIKANPDGNFLCEIKKSEELPVIVKAVNIAQGAEAFQGALKLKLSAPAVVGLGPALTRVFNSAPKARLTVYAADGLQSADKQLLLREAGIALTAVPQGSVLVDGNFKNEELATWATANRSLTSRIILGPKCIASVGQARSEPLIKDYGFQAVVPGADNIVVSYRPGRNAFAARDLRSNNVVEMKNLRFREIRDAMAKSPAQ